MGLHEVKIVMKKDEKKWDLTKLKIWNYTNVYRNRQKNRDSQ